MKAMLFIGVILFSTSLWAQDGSPDLSFGEGGDVQIPNTKDFDYCSTTDAKK